MKLKSAQKDCGQAVFQKAPYFLPRLQLSWKTLKWELFWRKIVKKNQANLKGFSQVSRLKSCKTKMLQPSGGEQQMLAMWSSTLMPNTPALLLDEPSMGAGAPIFIQEIFDIIQDNCQDNCALITKMLLKHRLSQTVLKCSWNRKIVLSEQASFPASDEVRKAYLGWKNVWETFLGCW